MRPLFVTLSAVVLATTSPALAFGGMGPGMGYTTPKITSTTGIEPNGLHRESAAANTAPQVVIDQAPYKLGNAIFNGTYKFGKAKVNHVAEKEHRLGILQTGLPTAEQKHFNPRELANHLNDRQTNALEYYIQVRFGRFVTVAPSWAKEEPPIKVINPSKRANLNDRHAEWNQFRRQSLLATTAARAERKRATR
jgi:hypothetical protein